MDLYGPEYGPECLVEGMADWFWPSTGLMYFHHPGVDEAAEGMYCNLSQSGPGLQVTRSGLRYEGFFAADKLQGQGTIRGPNGEVYTGQVVDGLPDGDGQLRLRSGTHLRGSWQGGRFQSDEAQCLGDSKLETGSGCPYSECGGPGRPICRGRRGRAIAPCLRNGLPKHALAGRTGTHPDATRHTQGSRPARLAHRPAVPAAIGFSLLDGASLAQVGRAKGV